MINFLYSILGFVIAIAILTAIHEYGHFWVARRLGVKVLRFSIGFGKILYSWYDKKGTEYTICAVPIGGYVKMLDQNEGHVPPNEIKNAFNAKPVWVRMLIIAAGPICNLLFAVLAYSLAFMWGISAIVPVIGDVPKNTVAYTAGLHSGQEIVAVDDNPTQTWEDVLVTLVGHVGEHNNIHMTVRDIHTHVTASYNIDLHNYDLHDHCNSRKTSL